MTNFRTAKYNSDSSAVDDPNKTQDLSSEEIAALKANDKVSSNTTGVTGADAITNMLSLTQAEYDAITPNASTFYVIVG